MLRHHLEALELLACVLSNWSVEKVGQNETMSTSKSFMRHHDQGASSSSVKRHGLRLHCTPTGKGHNPPSAGLVSAQFTSFHAARSCVTIGCWHLGRGKMISRPGIEGVSDCNEPRGGIWMGAFACASLASQTYDDLTHSTLEAVLTSSSLGCEPCAHFELQPHPCSLLVFLRPQRRRARGRDHRIATHLFCD